MAPDFDIEGLLKASLALEDAAYADPHLFSLSPFSSPDATPNRTPLCSTTSTPAQSPKLRHLPLPLDNPINTFEDALGATSPENDSSSRESRKKQQSRANRRQRRRDARTENFAAADIRESIVDKHVTGAVSVVSEMDAQAADVAKTGYIALDDRVRSRKVFQLEELVGSQSKFRLRLVEWDGKYVRRLLTTLRLLEWNTGRLFPLSTQVEGSSASLLGSLAPSSNGSRYTKKPRVLLKMHAIGQKTQAATTTIAEGNSKLCYAVSCMAVGSRSPETSTITTSTDSLWRN